MIKSSITYSESVETIQENGLKRWIRAEIEGQLEKGDNVSEC